MNQAALWQSPQMSFSSNPSRRFRRRGLKGLAAAFALLLAGASGAQGFPLEAKGKVDVKVYPGTMCRSSDRVSYDGYGRVFNHTNAAVIVTCPFVRDKVKGPWISIKVTVADRHPTEDIRCKAHSAREDGLTLSGTAASSTAYDTDESASQLLVLGSPSQHRDYGIFYLRCELPRRNAGRASGLLSYRIAE